MALKQTVTAVTAKEAALKDTASLRTAAQRLDPKDAIASEGKASKEQALAESNTQSATSDRKSVEDYEQAASSNGGGGSGDSTADLIVSVAAGQRELSAYDSHHEAEENFSPFAPSTQAERDAALASHLGLSELPPGLAGIFKSPEEAKADAAAEAHANASKSLWERAWDQARDIHTQKAEYEQFGGNSAIADGGSGTTQAGTALVNVTVGKDGEVKGGGTTSDDAFLNAASKAITGQIGNVAEALNQATAEQDSLQAPPPSKGTTTVHDLGDEKVVTRASEDGKVEVTTFEDGTKILYNANNGTTTTINPDGSTKTTNHATGEVTTTDPLKCPAPDGAERLTPLEKAQLIETIGQELHIPGSGEPDDGATDPVEGDGTQIFGAGGLTLDQVGSFRDQLVDPSDDATPAVAVVRPDPEAGADICNEFGDTSGTGPEDDPMDQGHDFTDETSLSSSDESSSSSAEADQGDTLTAFDILAFDLRLVNDPAAMLKNEDFDLLQQQSEPAADIVPDFHLESLPMPGLDLGPLFGSDLV